MLRIFSNSLLAITLSRLLAAVMRWSHILSSSLRSRRLWAHWDWKKKKKINSSWYGALTPTPRKRDSSRLIRTSKSACLRTSSARILFSINSASFATRTMWSFIAWESNLERKRNRWNLYKYISTKSQRNFVINSIFRQLAAAAVEICYVNVDGMYFTFPRWWARWRRGQRVSAVNFATPGSTEASQVRRQSCCSWRSSNLWSKMYVVWKFSAKTKLSLESSAIW